MNMWLVYIEDTMRNKQLSALNRLQYRTPRSHRPSKKVPTWKRIKGLEQSVVPSLDWHNPKAACSLTHPIPTSVANGTLQIRELCPPVTPTLLLSAVTPGNPTVVCGVSYRPWMYHFWFHKCITHSECFGKKLTHSTNKQNGTAIFNFK